MSVNEYREDIISQIPALHLLMNLGYEYLPFSEAVAARDFYNSKVVLEDILRKQLKRNNRFEFRGKTYSFSDGNIEKAMREITGIPFEGLMATNEKVYDLLTLGKSLEETKEGYKRSYPLKYIDWKKPENNVYHVCDEFIVERERSRKTRRPDIVIFVNGLPLVVIECKRPDIKDPLKAGISQQLRNQGAREIPQLFIYSQLLLSVCQNGAMYGTAGTEPKFWSLWKEEYCGEDKALLNTLVNRCLTKKKWEELFSEREDWQKEKMEEILSAGKRLPSDQDKTIYNLLKPDRLLELVKAFVVFDKKVKKVPRYQQYFAVKATMERITSARGEAERRGGVIWHTTGSGKSITMVLLAKAISMESSIRDPKVILVTDRIDLDEQICKTFQACGKEAKKADSGEDLFKLIEENKASIITTIIDKFESGIRKNKLKVNSRNIFVLVDESHRSQYGVSHARMKGVFPRACYIGFTGTPLLKKEKSTVKKFGGFIHTYSMNQAVEDGAVARLLYEGRMSELRGEKEQLDKWFERITEELTDEQKADLKRKFRREEELTKSEERLREITYDIIKHYGSTFQNSGLKGQLAVSSRKVAIKYKRFFDEFDRVSAEVIMSPPDTREGHEEVDAPEEPEVIGFWKKMMDKYGSPRKYQRDIIDAFKSPGPPEILIVIDKLLTGFDAPRNTVLYIDKRLKDHNILQAIARVNRLFEGKDFGYVIDYRGIFGELNDAIDLYNALEREGFDKKDVTGTISNVLEEIKKLPQYHTNVWEVFKGVTNRKDKEAMQRHLEPGDTREKFYQHLRIFIRTLQVALGNARFYEQTSVETLGAYKKDLKMFLSLRRSVKQRFGETVDYSSYEKQIRNMVDKYIGAGDVIQIVTPVDIFSVEAFERELEGIEGDAARADTIASRMKVTITEKMQEDPIFYKKLSEVISQAIAEHKARRLSDAEYLKKMREELDKVRNKGTGDVPEALKTNEEARAYYRLLVEFLDLNSITTTDPVALCTDMAVNFFEIVDKLKKRDWFRDPDTENSMYNELDDKFFYFKGKFELKVDNDTVDKIINEIIGVAKSREAEY